MKEHPILFSGPMVRAILEGRKTQTRRVIRDARGAFWDHAGWSPVVTDGYLCAWKTTDGKHTTEAGSPQRRCPYGQPGDLLWVREAFFEEYDPITVHPYDPSRYQYLATHEGEEPIFMDGDGGATVNKNGTFKSPWRPSIHMPRWASRLTLRITDVRVQRVQEITDGDVAAEGVDWSSTRIGNDHGSPARDAFAHLWDSINAKRGYRWDMNPWVWALTFEED